MSKLQSIQQKFDNEQHPDYFCDDFDLTLHHVWCFFCNGGELNSKDEDFIYKKHPVLYTAIDKTGDDRMTLANFLSLPDKAIKGYIGNDAFAEICSDLMQLQELEKEIKAAISQNNEGYL